MKVVTVFAVCIFAATPVLGGNEENLTTTTTIESLETSAQFNLPSDFNESNYDAFETRSSLDLGETQGSEGNLTTTTTIVNSGDNTLGRLYNVPNDYNPSDYDGFGINSTLNFGTTEGYEENVSTATAMESWEGIANASTEYEHRASNYTAFATESTFKTNEKVKSHGILNMTAIPHKPDCRGNVDFDDCVDKLFVAEKMMNSKRHPWNKHISKYSPVEYNY